MEMKEAEQMLIELHARWNRMVDDAGSHRPNLRLYGWLTPLRDARVVVGEMAKDGRYTPPALVMGRRQDIVDAVFERSFNKLSEAGRYVFLLVANWKSHVPEVDC